MMTADSVCEDGRETDRVHPIDGFGESLRSVEQRADDRRRLDRTLRRECASKQNANRSIRIDFGCYRHGVLLQERRGTPVPVVGEQSSPLGIPSRLMTQRVWISRAYPRAKKKRPPVLAN